MSRLNLKRKGCVDVFNSFLVTFATYAGNFEFPVIKASHDIPNKLISFSKAVSCTDYNQWVHFYEDDYKFERIWRQPKRYLNLLRKYNGVILPDFSLYRDMPFIMQLWNIYRSRAIGCWLQNHNIKVIPNIRFSDERSYNICCDGIAHNSTIAIGSHGTVKNTYDRNLFLEGLDNVIKILEPTCIIIYGTIPNNIREKYINKGITIITFESECATSHKEV